jgi:hypothetical protein
MHEPIELDEALLSLVTGAGSPPPSSWTAIEGGGAG